MGLKKLKKTSNYQSGKIVENKTLWYLLPATKVYGNLFMTKFSSLPIKAVGIFDKELEGSPILSGTKPLFILFSRTIRSVKTQDVLDWMKNQDFYISDYDFNENLKMLVINFPVSIQDAYDKFIDGKYSFMYTKDEIKAFFNRKTTPKGYNMFYKTSTAIEDHIKEVKKEYGTEISMRDIGKRGYHIGLPPKGEDEIFNY